MMNCGLDTGSQIGFEKCGLNLMDVLLFSVKVKETNSLFIQRCFSLRDLEIIYLCWRESQGQGERGDRGRQREVK